MIHVYVLHIVVYDRHQACIKSVEESLECFGVYPQIIRIAPWDSARLTDRTMYEEIGDVTSQEELELMYIGFFVHQ